MKIPGLGNISLSGIAKSATSMLSKLPGPAGMLGKIADGFSKFSSSKLGQSLGMQGGQSQSGSKGLSNNLQSFAKNAFSALTGGQSGAQLTGNILNGMLRGQGPMGAFQNALGGGSYGGGGGGGGGGVGPSGPLRGPNSPFGTGNPSGPGADGGRMVDQQGSQIHNQQMAAAGQVDQAGKDMATINMLSARNQALDVSATAYSTGLSNAKGNIK